VLKVNRYLIIADDFTGANDTGVQLARRGIYTKVVLTEKTIKADESSYVLDTESRSLSQGMAYNKVKQHMKGIELNSFKYLIKKVDSTLRGNISEEVKAIDDVMQSELVIFMPAFPDLNRTTLGGIHRLNGKPITETELSKDPKTPVEEDRLDKIMASAYDEGITHVSIDEIRNQAINLDVGRVFSFDAATNEDMKTVVEKVKMTGKKTLWIGSAAIADHLLESEIPMKPAMALIASVSAVTREQVKYAQDKGVKLVKVPVYELLKAGGGQKYIDEAIQTLNNNEDVILLSSATYDREELDKTIEIAASLGLTKETVSVRALEIIGGLADEIMSKVSISGLFLSGGDTAMRIFERIDAEGSVIIGEVLAGIPMMRISKGKYDGLKVITKAGAFGNIDAVTYGLRKLKELL